MSGFHSIAQKSKFLLISATAVTLGQSHGKIIQYISPGLYFLCPQYQKLGTNGFDMKSKSSCGSRDIGDGNKLKM